MQNKRLSLPEEVITEVIIECKIKFKFKGTDILRELAKSPQGRIMWSVAKNCGVPLFEGSVSSWNPLQRRFAYWLAFYGNVEGAYERPPSRVVQNNSLLDKWLEQKGREIEKRYEIEWVKGSAKITKTAYDQDEVYEL